MSRFWMLSLCLIAGGCTYTNDRPQAAPVAQKAARYVPPADQYVKSKLLDFDSPYDTNFVVAGGVRLVNDPQQPGNRVLLAPTATIKFTSLIRGRDFPGMWDLIGVRTRSEQGGTLRLGLTTSGGTRLAQNDATTTADWSVQWLELQKLPASMASDGELLLSVESTDRKAIYIDDILLAQSRTVVAQSTVPESNEPWRVTRSGLKWYVTAGEQTLLSLPAAPFVGEGYRVVESNPVRTVFASPASTIAIDRNGRLIENGKTKFDPTVSKFAKAVAENASPASIEVGEDEGRVERTLPGDKDNDGYDESRGCYTVRASASRLNVRLTPGNSAVRWPVIEVIGLPTGAVSVWLEGQLVPYVTRLSDGKVMIELPIRLERAVEAQIRVK